MKFKVQLDKCQGYGKCAHWAPDTFSVGENKKVVTGDIAATSDEMLFKAARSCPYRVITIMDDDGRQIFPAVKRVEE
jgi:ferredoxin